MTAQGCQMHRYVGRRVPKLGRVNDSRSREVEWWKLLFGQGLCGEGVVVGVCCCYGLLLLSLLSLLSSLSSLSLSSSLFSVAVRCLQIVASALKG